MDTPYSGLNIDLTEALKTFDRLQLEGGDLGAIYWYRISELVTEAENFRARALAAENKLARIQAFISQLN